ncbi:cyclic-phosphate processing receiver domain-containing protein [uncultured Acetobacteroides sp.]|uniref:cyclic-phosphate processing receiver domain-containing protein n=1 Tax=uncultured Acetobacteroides sp. TaxID=1760811 RepID=UPI0029F50423|nr:cyclic-phosphate processing receiver domain-containing protein [uncultured Acetobacteroides sp.]
MKTYKVLLDDYRDPEDLYYYNHDEVYLEQGWLVVRSFEEFTANISGYYHRGAFPSLVSFDGAISTLHLSRDVGRDLETYVEKSTVDCAEWLAEYVAKNHLEMPEVKIHASSGEISQSIFEVVKAVKGEL